MTPRFVDTPNVSKFSAHIHSVQSLHVGTVQFTGTCITVARSANGRHLLSLLIDGSLAENGRRITAIRAMH